MTHPMRFSFSACNSASVSMGTSMRPSLPIFAMKVCPPLHKMVRVFLR